MWNPHSIPEIWCAAASVRAIMVIIDGEQKAARIIIFDFGRVKFGRSRNPDGRQKDERRLPGTPISGRPDNFWQWIDWNWKPWLEGYKETEVTITQEQRDLFPVTESTVKYYEPMWPCPDEC